MRCEIPHRCVRRKYRIRRHSPFRLRNCWEGRSVRASSLLRQNSSSVPLSLGRTRPCKTTASPVCWKVLFAANGLALSVFALAAGSPSLPAAQNDGFTPLFDGKSFDGWYFTLRANKDGSKPDPKLTWSIVDGYIRCTGKPNGCMVTQKEYGDYILKLKWRFPAGSKGGNSGVLLHVQDDEIWPTSVEAQLQAGQAGDFWPFQHTGVIAVS